MSKKTISINPDLFKVSAFESNTRKKRKTNNDSKPKIKVRSKEKPKNNKTLKRNLINMIRKHQRDKFKKQQANSKHKEPSFEPVSKDDFSKNDEVVNFNNDFNESVTFLKELTKRNEEKEKLKQYQNKTLKQYKSPTMTSAASSIAIPSSVSPAIQEPTINLNMPQTLQQPITDVTNNFTQLPPLQTYKPVTVNYDHYKPPPPPPYGCLKNGSLPLYKNWKNSTQKNLPIIDDDAADNRYVQKAPTKIDSIKLAHNNHMRTNVRPFLNRHLKKPKKMRKIIRRTYRVGRSKVKPKISVLISNRTIRNNITTKKQLLKQIPIAEIRNYLINHGFIRIGSNSPNDVLRKMYETASMVCGEIHNHNPENVIFNYMNGKQDAY